MESQDLRTRIPSVMEDPGARSVAKVYSQAYLDVAGPAGCEAALEELGSFLSDVLGGESRVRSHVADPRVERGGKTAAS